MNVLDIFSGIGAFSLGLERAGMRTVAFCEQERYCQLVLRKHWPAVPIFSDVRHLHAVNVGRVDVICGGFPCQDISFAGLGAGLDGARSGLWWEYHRLIAEIRPQFALIENVSALRSRGLDRVLGSLAEIGYDAEWHCIPASYVGAPHDRDRLWIIAYPQRSERREEPYGRALGRMGRQQQSFPWDRDWQGALCEFRGMDDGTAYGVDRIDTLRNAVVPQVAEIIGKAILESRQTV